MNEVVTTESQERLSIVYILKCLSNVQFLECKTVKVTVYVGYGLCSFYQFSNTLITIPRDNEKIAMVLFNSVRITEFCSK